MLDKAKASTKNASRTVFVNELTNGLLDPVERMLGPVADGGVIIANTAPGCWGPMITPEIRGGHEVTRPVAVEGAEIGDAIAIRIRSLVVTSAATASGNDKMMVGRFNGDPYCAEVCLGCGTQWPSTRVEGIGETAIRCTKCGADAAPFTFANGYTIAFDEERQIGVTVDKKKAEAMARDADRLMALPDASIQNPILTFAPTDLVGMVTRLRPFLGQLGTTPSKVMPDSHNAGDFGTFLVGAPHVYSLTPEELTRHKTDGHLDVNSVREGAVLICPVKVSGGGIYMGDMHALQGDGEIAGHTCDVAGTVTLEVSVIKELNIDGPILFPVAEDIPVLARPLNAEERHRALALARKNGVPQIEADAPISFIGTGANLNEATNNGLERAAKILGLSVPEVMNRATMAGAIEIGRHPGVVRVTFRAPLKLLTSKGLGVFAESLYTL
ncbi:acetamidase/formamidase family protein [Bradyrhizobium sp. Arg68]|uniref:acetamidase/formamidase family protein n=1 Tax=Bradyrhizobium ivorense TaxID=2511166 RepID=UPI001E53C7E5|nr:acetamidase/formamidase family protein [Bradyrhizobium ivorense]MCC8938523.1 acetamidase/formamidase family protein [Bradyrhizobium ivorense]